MQCGSNGSTKDGECRSDGFVEISDTSNAGHNLLWNRIIQQCIQYKYEWILQKGVQQTVT